MEKFRLKVKPIIIFVNFKSYSIVSIGSSISVRNMSEYVRFEGYPLCIHCSLCIVNEIKAYYRCGAIFEHNRNDSVQNVAPVT